MKVTVVESSDVQPLAQARNPCLHIFSAWLLERTRRVGWRLAHVEDLVANDTRRLGTCVGTAAHARGRLAMEPGDTNLRDALTKLLDDRRMAEFLTSTVYEFRDCRASLALEARSRTTSLTVRKSAVFSG